MGMTNTTTSADAVLSRYLSPALATAYVPSPSGMPDPTERLALELRNLTGDLEGVVDEEDAGRLVEAMTSRGHQPGRTLVGVLGPDDVDVWSTSAELQAAIAPGPVPDLAPLLAARQAWIPHAVVLVDRVGADVEIVEAQDSSKEVSVDGATSHITKVNPGGWSQRRFQQRAEEHWQDNAQLVAERLSREVDRTGLDLIVVTGDKTAFTVLEEVLPPRLQDMVLYIDAGGRSADGSEEQVEEAVDQAVRQEASKRREAQRQQVSEAIGQGVGAVGRDEVLAALFERRVDTLVVHQPDTEGLHAHIGPQPDQVAGDSGVLHDLGLDATRVPLIDAALRGAAASGAQVVMLHSPHEDLVDGLGASLRGDEPTSLDGA